MSAVDETLEALRAELTIEPSPDLAARVRSRVAQRRAPARRAVWILPAAAAAVLLVGALVWWLREPRPVPRPAAAVTSPPAGEAASSTNVPPSMRAPEVTSHPRPTATRRVVAPVVQPLVPAGEAARIARYAASMRQRPFEAETLPGSDPREPLADPAPIEVAPLDTQPLVDFDTQPLVHDEGSLR